MTTDDSDNDLERELIELGDTAVEQDGGERQVRLWAEIVIGAALEPIFTDAVRRWCAGATPTTVTVPAAGAVAWPWATPHLDGRQELPAVFRSVVPFSTDVARQCTASYGTTQITALTPVILSNTFRRLARWAEGNAASSGDTDDRVRWLGVAAGAEAMRETTEFLARAGHAVIRDTPELEATIRNAMAAGLL